MSELRSMILWNWVKGDCWHLCNFLERFHHWRREHEKRGAVRSIHGRIGMIIKSKRVMNAELWFSEFVDSLANRMPDVNRKELPACLTVLRVYSHYCEAVRGKTAKPLSLAQFRRMWRNNFPEVIIPKVTGNFFLKKCLFCKWLQLTIFDLSLDHDHALTYFIELNARIF